MKHTIENNFSLRPFTLGFRDPNIATDYRRDQFDRIIGPTRVLCVAAAILFILAWLFNSQVRAAQADITPQVLIELALFNSILLYIMVPLCVALFVCSYLPFAVSLFQFGAALMGTLVISASVGMVLSDANLTAQHYSFAFLLFNVWVIYTISQLRYLYAAAICLVGSAAFVALLHYRFAEPLAESATYLFLLAGANMLGPLAAYHLDKTSRNEFINRRKVEQRERELAIEKEKSERLLLNILPESIADRLKSDTSRIADRFDEVTVLFADIAGFTDQSSQMSADQLVGMLDTVFSQFDEVADRLGLEKIKTIGDAYMVAAGVPSNATDHADRIADFALEIRALAGRLTWPDGLPLQMRIGIASGPAVAGVIGRQKFIYDLWGDTVNTASRMESHGHSGEIQIDERTRELLQDKYPLTPRGEVEIKGKGLMETWWLAAEDLTAGT